MHKPLFSRRVVFITGKGGVGKTTIASALAVAARERGLRTLLVEVGVTENLCQIFKKPLPVYDVARIEDGLFALRLDPYLALKDYLTLNMKVEWAARKFLETDVIRYLTQAAPGWRELITLGKIWKLQNDRDPRDARKPEWDFLVIDAPATGHGISFLKVPQIILDTFRYGPIRYQTQEVHKMLLDPARTLLNVVTLPEEMPMNEAGEIYRAARETLLMPFGYVFVNMMPPAVIDAEMREPLQKLARDKKALAVLDARLPGGSARLLAAANHHLARRTLAEQYVHRARARIDAPFIEVPDLARPAIDRDALAVLATHLAGAVE